MMRLNARMSKEIDNAFINFGDRGKPSRLASIVNEFRFQRDSMGLCPKPAVHFVFANPRRSG